MPQHAGASIHERVECDRKKKGGGFTHDTKIPAMMTEMPVSVVLAILILSRTEHDYFVVIVQAFGGSSIINFRSDVSGGIAYCHCSNSIV